MHSLIINIIFSVKELIKWNLNKRTKYFILLNYKIFLKVIGFYNVSVFKYYTVFQTNNI